MESVTIVEIINLLPSMGVSGLLLFFLWLILVDKRLMLRSDHEKQLTDQADSHAREMAEKDREMAEKDRQLRRAEAEGDGWRDIALRNTGLLEQAAPILTGRERREETRR